MDVLRWLCALSVLTAACASRDVPQRFPRGSAASPNEKPAPVANVTRAFSSDGPWSDTEDAKASETPFHDHAGHGAHHGH